MQIWFCSVRRWCSISPRVLCVPDLVEFNKTLHFPRFPGFVERFLSLMARKLVAHTYNQHPAFTHIYPDFTWIFTCVKPGFLNSEPIYPCSICVTRCVTRFSVPVYLSLVWRKTKTAMLSFWHFGTNLPIFSPSLLRFSSDLSANSLLSIQILPEFNYTVFYSVTCALCLFHLPFT